MSSTKAKSMIAALLLFAIVIAVFYQPAKKLPQEMYIWQRIWTVELKQAIKQWSPNLSTLRILSAYSQQQSIKTININWQAIPKDVPIILVVRINGTQLPETKSIQQKLNHHLKNKQHNIQGIEIDFDAATSKLGKYQQWLKSLKPQLNNMQLSITALPTWSTSNMLPTLLAELDNYVLQVHSVLSPTQGLFDAKLSIKWAKQFNQISKTPFTISLPNYWYDAQIDNSHKITSLTAEGRQQPTSQNSRQLFAKPKDLHQAITQIEKLNLKHLKSWAWFRLPTSRDNNIFSDSTLKQLIANNSTWQHPKIQLTLKPIANTNNFDLWLHNQADIDQATASQYQLQKECKIKHLIQPYTHKNHTVQLKHLQLFKPKQKKRIGWVQCARRDK